MAIRTTNITALLVGEVIDSRTTQVGASCVRENINRWSKYKPVRGSWPASDNGKYGLDMANNWAYLAPRGTPHDEPLRIGDFRGYEHSVLSAFPGIQARQSDHAFYTLNPAGSPFVNSWRIRCYHTASDTVALPSDMGMEGYYYGLKISFGGNAWYKTFGTIAAVGFDPGQSFIVSAELIDPSGPTYAGLPYGVGTCSWELILCSSQHTAWTATVPSNLCDFPIGTDGIETWIASGSFEVEGWITGSDDAKYFAASGSSYQASIIYATKDTNPEFALDSKPAWATVGIYTGGSLVSNPTLWASGMEARITVSQNYGSTRSGSVVFSSEGRTFSITVDQEGAPATVTVSPYDGEDWTMTNNSGSIANGSTQLNFIFTPVGLSPASTQVYVTIYRDGIGKYNGTCNARDGFVTNQTVTINETAESGSTYEVKISREPPV